ncbi:hypothetical protein LSAT2_026355 [Lamellibrachia satsuma]|nr:hypothetical protein LSAT2_026355 [Lamellibrachia satsuma]
MAPFELNCNNIDIDGDGKLDCIAAGRMGTAVAFNPRNGTILWSIDDGVIHRTWNFYNVLIMPDFTQDGVPEILLSHGGDPRFHANELRRLAGRLVLVNGRTGHSLGRFLNMSRYKETYMSPALHTTKDGSQYVLYGQGGETARGDLLGISVPDLYRYVKELPSSTPIPNTKGSYTGWKDKVRPLKNGVFVIYRSDTRGVMVTPTLVDMNNDGIHDIMMSVYDGTIQLFDGETLDIMWSTQFPGFESYSTLAPAYFNDDDTLDFMLHMNKGSWPKYLYSQTLVLDGTNGEVLWRLNASQYEMTSDLVARTTEDYRDTFVFQAKGVNVPTTKSRNTRSHLHDVIKKRGLSDTPVIYNEGDANFTNLEKLFNKTDLRELESLGDTDSHGTGNDEGNEDGDDDPQDNPATVEQDGSDSDDDEHYPDCSEDMKTYTTYVFMLDRSNVHAPNVLLQLPSLKLHYNVTSGDQTVEVSRRQARSAGSLCIILKNDERTTGVLGDVDGDGNMDVISIVDGEGEKKDRNGDHVGMSYSMRIVKTNLVDALSTRGRYPAKLDLFVAKKMRDVRGIKPIEKVQFRPLVEQPWTQYLGQRSDNKMTVNK